MPPDPNHRGDDQVWVAGVFYANHNDPRFLVEKRSGLGWTFNFAHAPSWGLMSGLFAFLGFVQLIFFLSFHSFINLVLLCLFLAPCLLLFAGYLRVRASRSPLPDPSLTNTHAIPWLKPSYHGGEISISGPVTLSIVHQSQDGDLKAKWIRNDLGIEYACEGTITREGTIILISTDSHKDSTLRIHGSLLPNGQLEGALYIIAKDGSSSSRSAFTEEVNTRMRSGGIKQARLLRSCNTASNEVNPVDFQVHTAV